MPADEILPSGRLTPFRCWCDVVAPQDVAERFDPRGDGPGWTTRRRCGRNPSNEFSRAKRTTSASTSGSTRGRPAEARSREPSNLRAISRRYHTYARRRHASQHHGFSLNESRTPTGASKRLIGWEVVLPKGYVRVQFPNDSRDEPIIRPGTFTRPTG
jgi:hypothetical protein